MELEEGEIAEAKNAVVGLNFNSSIMDCPTTSGETKTATLSENLQLSNVNHPVVSANPQAHGKPF